MKNEKLLLRDARCEYPLSLLMRLPYHLAETLITVVGGVRSAGPARSQSGTHRCHRAGRHRFAGGGPSLSCAVMRDGAGWR
jgi:hypothetical protein